jgi:hypothetical protein
MISYIIFIILIIIPFIIVPTVKWFYLDVKQ